MKASIPRFLAVCAALGFAASGPLSAQDVIVQKDGQRREGEITGMKGESIRIKVGPVETAVPLANAASVDMKAPAEFDAALQTWQSGNPAAALAKLTPLVQKFRGLPVPWVVRASALLPEALLAANRTADAESALQDFKKAYPDSAAAADLVTARLSFAKGHLDDARTRLEPIVQSAKGVKLPGGPEAVSYSQAICLLGDVQNQSGDKPAALANYLLVTTLFNDDASSAKRAAEQAEILQNEKTIVP